MHFVLGDEVHLNYYQYSSICQGVGQNSSKHADFFVRCLLLLHLLIDMVMRWQSLEGN
jgi:hypothetical protein